MSLKIKTPYGTKITIQETIGEGGFGTVYSVLTDKGEKFAMKAVLPEQGEIGLNLCKNESRNLKKCRDLPFVMDYIETFAVDNKFFIISPKYKRIPKNASPDQIAIWFYQLLYGVNEIHKKGIIHGDIKVGNIMLDENDNIKIIDFGISVKIGSHERDICPHILKSKKRLRDTIEVYDKAIKRAKESNRFRIEKFPEASPYDDLVCAGYTILAFFNCGKIFNTIVDDHFIPLQSIKELFKEMNEISIRDKIKEILSFACKDLHLFSFFFEFLTDILCFDREEDEEPTIPDILRRMEKNYPKIIFKKK